MSRQNSVSGFTCPQEVQRFILVTFSSRVDNQAQEGIRQATKKAETPLRRFRFQ
jgi:hypothetical protein